MPFPSPGDLPNSGIESMSPTLAGEFFTTEPPEKPQNLLSLIFFIRDSLKFVTDDISLCFLLMHFSGN